MSAFFLFGVSAAQTVTTAAGSLTPLSALGSSARADALGDALVGLADEPSALFFNSAGLSQLKFASLSLNHNSYLADSFEETILFGTSLGSFGGVAGALQYVAWGGLDKRDINGVPQGQFNDGDIALSLGWGFPLAKELSLGLALHGVQQKIIDSLDTILSGDLGILFTPDPLIHAGLTFSGLGTNFSGFIPTQDLRLGFSSRLRLGKGAELLPLLAGDWEPRGASRIQFGLEGRIEGNYFLRVGYQAALDDNQIGGLTGFTVGAGIRLESLQLDYAFVPYGDLGTSHRISLGYEFPNPTPVAAKPVTVMGSPVTVQTPPVTVMAPVQPVPVTVGSPKTKVELLFELPAGEPAGKNGPPGSTLAAPYEKIAQENPRDSLAWRKLGIVYLKMGQDAKGIQCLEQALRLNPSDFELKKWLDDYHVKHPGAQ